MEVNYVLNKEQFLALKAAWKRLEEADDIKAEDVVVYNILRGKDSKNGFAPTTNPKKIQGHDAWFQHKTAVSQVKHKYVNKRHGDRVYYAGTFISQSEFQEKRNAEFKARYGVELTPEVAGALE